MRQSCPTLAPHPPVIKYEHRITILTQHVRIHQRVGGRVGVVDVAIIDPFLAATLLKYIKRKTNDLGAVFRCFGLP